MAAKTCAAAFERIFYVEDCVAASENILCFFKERVSASEKISRKSVRLLLKKKCAAAS